MQFESCQEESNRQAEQVGRDSADLHSCQYMKSNLQCKVLFAEPWSLIGRGVPGTPVGLQRRQAARRHHFHLDVMVLPIVRLAGGRKTQDVADRKSTRLNSSHLV